MKMNRTIERYIRVSSPCLRDGTCGDEYVKNLWLRAPYLYASVDNDTDCHDWEDSYERVQKLVKHLPYKQQLEESIKYNKVWASKCLRCGRTKEDVRHGTEPPQCNPK